MNKKAIKEYTKYLAKSAIPKKLIYEKKKHGWLEDKASRLNREAGRNVKASDLKSFLGGSYKNIANFLDSIDFDSNDFYFYSIDEYKYLRNDNFTIDNLSPNYTVFFEPLNVLREDFKNLKDSEYVFNAISKYLERAKKHLEKLPEFKTKNSRIKKQHEYLSRIETEPVESFDEALQRILFFNAIIWQTEHRLIGFGPLDRILEPYYQKDLKSKIETEKSIKEKIKNFCRIAHQHYIYKSNNLAGDTGQIIQLSGYYEKNKTFLSKLDYIFIEVVKELQLPDPKILLRVTKDTPRDLYELSLECIKTGIGCPLFANDDVVIPALTNLRYKEEEAYNYSTSACWEPMIYGKSADQNNQYDIIPVNILNNVLEKTAEYASFDDFMAKFYEELKTELINVEIELKYKRYSLDPILTFMTEECKKHQLDITKGGAKYFNYGILTVSFANFVNSLFIIKKYVFNEKKYTISELNDLRIQEKFDDLTPDKTFGEDDEEVIAVVNKTMQKISNFFKDKKNYYGGNFNVGFSSPGYIEKSKDSAPSLDGRKQGDPFSVHISADGPLAYSELINFAGKLDYFENRYNGNVIDFMVSKDFIENNFDKFVDFLMLSREAGYFEMQMNVTSSKILIEAKNNPDKFPNLIVRVWGFSAYFNDLPEEYKDLLIERALKTEGK